VTGAAASAASQAINPGGRFRGRDADQGGAARDLPADGTGDPAGVGDRLVNHVGRHPERRELGRGAHRVVHLRGLGGAVGDLPGEAELTADPTLVDTERSLPAAQQYDYVFDGDSEELSGILASPSLGRLATFAGPGRRGSQPRAVCQHEAHLTGHLPRRSRARRPP
jgi:hypothetical protein